MRMNETSATIRILVASDSHVGYAERDVIRGRDSINSFNEVMELAKNRDVDMVLLAGDLFHDSKPSQSSMFEVIRSLRINCLGNKPCEVQVLADDPVIGHDKDVQHINTQDYHVNVAIPVYSIHGNHDDPSGFGGLCALDIIQAAGLVNYFGRVPQSNDITVRPILMQKGTTRLALYGLSNVREERLHQSMRSGKVAFMRPSLDDTGTVDDSWLNILAVHQNHHAHSTTNYLPESMIPNWFNLIVWGHEHECLIDPVENQEQGFAVCQPGSSVATSLCQGEAQTKHVGILTIKGKDFSMEKIPLKTVRPFIMKEYRLVDEIDEAQNRTKNGKAQQGKAAVIDFLIRKVDEAIEEAIDEWLETHQGAELDGENTTLTRSDCPCRSFVFV
ncbi:Apoenzyme [Protomyces lactucae-debilis]|uniref:Apoenzyme n=1 Tax=Protomyces lactucae-debilis TaxID=2754530 RepID=A0A1Y2FQ92_PROLT|nr:Apoenzyme [Protomyces lactucae-debilis]ORY85767.1 Apoenzyme [Protomyces lactucae-debilis]